MFWKYLQRETSNARNGVEKIVYVMDECFYDLDLYEGWILAWWRNFDPDHRDQSVLNLRWQHDHANLVWRKRLLCPSGEPGPNTPVLGCQVALNSRG